uniref:Secreted protein n=1 Tax=Rhipicephalus appendiculatus TaxID=34631 RepID=A0A131YGS0_RHIAP
MRTRGLNTNCVFPFILLTTVHAHTHTHIQSLCFTQSVIQNPTWSFTCTVCIDHRTLRNVSTEHTSTAMKYESLSHTESGGKEEFISSKIGQLNCWF